VLEQMAGEHCFRARVFEREPLANNTFAMLPKPGRVNDAHPVEDRRRAWNPGYISI